MESAKSWVIITETFPVGHTFYPKGGKSIRYSGPQCDNGTSARCYYRDLTNRARVTHSRIQYRLYIWDLTPYGGGFNNAPKWLKEEILKVEKEFNE